MRALGDFASEFDGRFHGVRSGRARELQFVVQTSRLENQFAKRVYEFNLGGQPSTLRQPNRIPLGTSASKLALPIRFAQWFPACAYFLIGNYLHDSEPPASVRKSSGETVTSKKVTLILRLLLQQPGNLFRLCVLGSAWECQFATAQNDLLKANRHLYDKQATPQSCLVGRLRT